MNDVASATPGRMIRHAGKSQQPACRPAVRSATRLAKRQRKIGRRPMRGHARLVVFALAAFTSLLISPAATFAADPEIDALLRAPVGKDWITNGGNLSN